jgi:hypothetical protein
VSTLTTLWREIAEWPAGPFTDGSTRCTKPLDQAAGVPVGSFCDAVLDDWSNLAALHAAIERHAREAHGWKP